MKGELFATFNCVEKREEYEKLLTDGGYSFEVILVTPCAYGKVAVKYWITK